MELLSPPVTLAFGGTVTLLSTEAARFYIPSAMREGSDSPASSPSLVVIFLVITLPGGVKWPLIVTLSCVSVMTDDVELLFMCLLAISLSYLEKGVFRSSAHLKKIRLFVHLLLSLDY